MDAFEGEYEYFEVDPGPDGQPVKFTENRGHVA